MGLQPKTLRILGLLSLSLVVACGIYTGNHYWHRQPQISDNNNYENPPAYPQRTANFILQKRELFSDPMNGIGLRYQSSSKAGVSIDINLYPVGATSWVNNPNLLDDEASVILADADYLIREHQWQERNNTLREAISIGNQEGLRLQFTLRQGSQILFTVVDLFQAEDKFIKFTQKFPSPDVNFLNQARANLEEFLPQLKVPPESAYVHRLRQAHVEEMKKKVQALLQKNKP